MLLFIAPQFAVRLLPHGQELAQILSCWSIVAVFIYYIWKRKFKHIWLLSLGIFAQHQFFLSNSKFSAHLVCSWITLLHPCKLGGSFSKFDEIHAIFRSWWKYVGGALWYSRVACRPPMLYRIGFGTSATTRGKSAFPNQVLCTICNVATCAHILDWTGNTSPRQITTS